MQQTLAQIINDCKVIELIYKNNEFYTVLTDGTKILIASKTTKAEYTIRYEKIKEVVFMSSGNVKFDMKGKAFLYMNRTYDMIHVGL